MSQDLDQKRKITARVERLRRRLDNVPDSDPATEGLIDVVKGILDLLEDKR